MTIQMKETTRLYSGRVLKRGEAIDAAEAIDANGRKWYVVGRDLVPERAVECEATAPTS